VRQVDDLMRVAILSAYPVVRAGLRQLLESQDGVVVVGDAACTADAVSLALEERPSIILVDPDAAGITLGAVAALTEASNSRVLVFTSATDPAVYARAIEVGAWGVVSKEQPAELLRRAVRTTCAGEMWLERSKTAPILLHAARRWQDPEAKKIATLTKREREIVSLVGDGLKSIDMAERLFISRATVRNHLTSILGKLGLSDRYELAVYAFRHDLVERGAVVHEGPFLAGARSAAPTLAVAADAPGRMPSRARSAVGRTR
jgi:two-component system nitrate/nitrite response regulator NarL